MAHNEIQFGSIVHHDDLPDPEGNPVGPHYAVVLSNTSDIKAGEPLFVAGITTSFSRPLPDGWFLITDYIPGKPGGHAMTGLSQLSVVKGTWVQALPQDEFSFNRKHLPKSLAKQLLAWVTDKIAESERDSQ